MDHFLKPEGQAERMGDIWKAIAFGLGGYEGESMLPKKK